MILLICIMQGNKGKIQFTTNLQNKTKIRNILYVCIYNQYNNNLPAVRTHNVSSRMQQAF